MTSRMIRKARPSLALRVQNFAGSDPITKPASFSEHGNTDYFLIELDLEEIRDIVYILTDSMNIIVNSTPPDNPLGISLAVVMQSLIEAWLRYAQLKFNSDESHSRAVS